MKLRNYCVNTFTANHIEKYDFLGGFSNFVSRIVKSSIDLLPNYLAYKSYKIL